MIKVRIINYIKSFFLRLQKDRVKAVYDDDLLSLLNSLGIKKQIENGEYRCKYCNTVITLDKIHILEKSGGEIKIVCSNPVCINKLPH